MISIRRKKVSVGAIMLYAGVMFASNYLASLSGASTLLIVVVPFIGKIPTMLFYVLSIAVYLIFGLFLPLICTWLFFRFMVPRQYIPSEGNVRWLKSLAMFVLPGETIRFVTCCSSLGHISNTGLFAILPSFLFENTYLLWAGRSYAVRNLLQYNVADFVIYALCYLIYAAVHLLITGWIYRYFWLKSKRERDDLIVLETEMKYY